MCIDGLRECGVVTELPAQPNNLDPRGSIHNYVIAQSLAAEREVIAENAQTSGQNPTSMRVESDTEVSVVNYLHGYSNRQACMGKLAALLYKIVEWFKSWRGTSDYLTARAYVQNLMSQAHEIQNPPFPTVQNRPDPLDMLADEIDNFGGGTHPMATQIRAHTDRHRANAEQRLQQRMRTNAEQRLQEMLTLYNQNLVTFTAYKPKVDIQHFLDKAQAYVNQNYAKRNAGTRAPRDDADQEDVDTDPSDVILGDITAKLKNLEFRSNPQQFWENWQKERGQTEEWRGGEDDALRFFEKEVMPTLVKV